MNKPIALSKIFFASCYASVNDYWVSKGSNFFTFGFSGHVRLLCNSHGFLTASHTFLLPALRSTMLNNFGIKTRFRRSIIIGYSTQESSPKALIGSIWLKYLHNQGQLNKIFSLPTTMEADPSWPHCTWCSPAWFIPFVTIDTVEYVTGIWNGHLIFRSRNLYYLCLIIRIWPHENRDRLRQTTWHYETEASWVATIK